MNGLWAQFDRLTVQKRIFANLLMFLARRLGRARKTQVDFL